MRTGLARALIAFFWFSIIITIITIIVLVDRKEENPEEKVYAPLFFSSTACFFVCFFHSFFFARLLVLFPLFTYSTAQKPKNPRETSHVYAQPEYLVRRAAAAAVVAIPTIRFALACFCHSRFV